MNIYTKITFLLTFIFLSGTVWGQRDVPKTLYLKDGSFVLGSLVGKSTTEYIWQLSDGTQIKFPKELVRDVKEPKKGFQYFDRGKMRRTKGFYGRILAGAFLEKKIAEYSSVDHAPSVNMTVGYKLHSKLSVGIGTGFDRYVQGPPIIPLYLDLSGDVFNKAITPYYKLSVGFGFDTPTKEQKVNTNVNYDGGFLVHPSLGVKFYTRSNVAWIFDFGYRFQRYDRQIIWDDNPERWTLQRTTIRIGMEF